MKKNEIIVIQVSFIVALFSVFVAFINLDYKILTTGLIIDLGIVLFVLLKRTKKNIVLIMYIISMITFLLYLPIQNLILGKEPLYMGNISFSTLILLILAFNGLKLGFFLIKDKKKEAEYSNNKLLSYSALLLIIFTAPFACILAFKNVDAVRILGYAGLYSEKNVSSMIIERLANFNSAFIYIFLATLPNKKFLKKTLIIILPLLSIDLLTGRRGEAILNIMIVITYYILRNYYVDKDINQFKFKEIVKIPIIGFFIVAISIIISQTRLSQEIDFTNILSTFFEQQSGTYTMIESTLYYKDSLKATGSIFSLQALYNGVEVIDKVVHSLFPEEGMSKLFQSNLGNAITYFREPIYYKNGGSFGTSYIAELNLDFGLFGVFIYNVFIGVVLKLINRLNFNNWIIFSFTLFFLKSIYFVPRESAFNWVNQFVSFTNIGAILLVWFLHSIIKSLGGKNR
ncbi:MAG: O-antigen polysaccharide polymerase Wzy family protein [Carnobacterium sp.]|uniref:O-antigen polysaccharide polymerase Wzy family protein n=1 Tax=Carnobacterium sp. TaxID=48221 RepID=UPI0033161F84